MLALDAARHGLRVVRRSKRLLALTALTHGLICLIPALYLGRAVHQAAGTSADATLWAKTLSMSFLADLERHHAPGFKENLSVLIVGSLLLTFVVRPLVLGGFVGIAASDRRLRFDEFVREGGAVYWKFLRAAILTLLIMYLLSLVAKPLLTYIDDLAKERQSEQIAVEWRRFTELVVFAGFLAAATILDYVRVGIHMYRRPGVMGEIVRSVLFVMQHPVKTLGLGVAAFLLELGLIWAAAPVFQFADGAYILSSVTLLVLLQLFVCLREGTRLFHLGCAWHVRSVEEREERAIVLGEAHAAEPDILANLPWNA